MAVLSGLNRSVWVQERAHTGTCNGWLLPRAATSSGKWVLLTGRLGRSPGGWPNCCSCRQVFLSSAHVNSPCEITGNIGMLTETATSGIHVRHCGTVIISQYRNPPVSLTDCLNSPKTGIKSKGKSVQLHVAHRPQCTSACTVHVLFSSPTPGATHHYPCLPPPLVTLQRPRVSGSEIPPPGGQTA